MLDDELAALWLKDVQNERNPAFELVVMRRLEQALFRRAIALTVAVIAAVTLFLAFCAPILTAIWGQTFGHFVSAPVVALFLMAISFVLSKMSANPGHAKAT